MLENTTPPFEKLVHLMECVQLPYKHITIDSENKVEQIAVSLGLVEDVPVSVQILFLEDVVKAISNQENESKFSTLQFYLILPVNLTPENVSGLSSLLLSINPFISLGAFGISNTDDVFYRYNLLQDKRDINENLVTEVIENINFYVKSFGSQVIRFTKGLQTLEDSLKNVFRALQA